MWGQVLVDPTELRRLVSLYDLEVYLFDVVSRQFAETGTLSAYDFFAIVAWKSNRSKTKIRNGIEAAGRSVAGLTQEVNESPSPVAKLESLLQVRGIGLPIASAILSVCYPQDYTVLDYRAWDTAQKMDLNGLPSHYPRNPGGYLQYCKACSRFARRAGISLRDLDRALWARSWEDDLRGLINGLSKASVSADQVPEPIRARGGNG